MKHTRSEVRVEYPPLPWKLLLFWHVFLLGIVVVAYAQHIVATHPWALAGAFAVFAAFVSTYLYGGRAPRAVAVGEEGMRIDKHMIPWEKIKSIDHGPFWLRHAVVRVRVDKAEKGFFDFPETVFGSHRGGYLAVYRPLFTDILPEVRRRAPEVEFSSVVEKKLQKPDASLRPKHRFVAAALAVNLVLLVLLWPSPTVGFMTTAYAGYPLMLISGFMHPPSLVTREDAFLSACVHAPFVVLVALAVHLLFIPPFGLYPAMLTVGILFCVLGAVTLWLRQVPAFRIQAGLAMLVVAVAGGTYLWFEAGAFPLHDVTGEIPSLLFAVWGESGTHVAPLSNEHLDRVIHVGSMKVVRIPDREGSERIGYLGPRYVVRIAGERAESEQMWAFDFVRKQDELISTSERIRVSKTGGLSAENGSLTWLEKSTDGVQTLCARELGSRGARVRRVELLEDIRWKGARWGTDGGIVVYGVGRQSEAVYHVLRVSPEGRTREHIQTKRQYRSFHVGPGMRYAMGSESEEWWQDPAHCVDLVSGKSIPMPPGGGPLHFTSPSAGYRIVSGKNGPRISRFDLKTGEEKAFCRVPPNTPLVGVHEESGRALLGPGGRDSSLFVPMPYYVLVHIPSGRQHWIHLSGMGVFDDSGPSLSASIPLASPLSPDGQNLLLESLTFGRGERSLLLCPIPSGWPEE